jgi:hypothetical protein
VLSLHVYISKVYILLQLEGRGNKDVFGMTPLRQSYRASSMDYAPASALQRKTPFEELRLSVFINAEIEGGCFATPAMAPV